MKINIVRGIIIVFLILNFITIFEFSNQNGEQSSSISRKITEQVIKNIKLIQKKTPKEKESILEIIETVIRKMAHLGIYTTVGILLMTLLSTYKLTSKLKLAISLFIGMAYAISDEIHQLFSPRKKCTNSRYYIRHHRCNTRSFIGGASY